METFVDFRIEYREPDEENPQSKFHIFTQEKK